MNTYKYRDFDIFICEAPSYSFGSADNKYYDRVIRIEETDYYKCVELIIKESEHAKTVLLAVPFYTPSDFCVVSNNGLFLMLDSVICLFKPETLEITAQKTLPTMGSMFRAYSYEEDYILYGEIDIYRVNSELSIIWQFSARDIFVRYRGDEPAFEMKEDRICLIDFLDYYYEIDYDGKVLTDLPLHQ